MDPRIGGSQHSHQQQQVDGPQKTFRGKPIQTGLTKPERGILGTIVHVLTAPVTFFRHKLSSKPYSSLTFSRAFPDGKLNDDTFGLTMEKLGKAQRSGEDYSVRSSGIDKYLRDQFRAEGDNGFVSMARFRQQVEGYKEKLQQDIENAKEGLAHLDKDIAAKNLIQLQNRLAGVNVVLESHERIVADELFIHMDEDELFAMIPLENLIEQIPEDSDARGKLQDFLNNFEPDERPTISANLKTIEQVLGKNTDSNYWAFNGAQVLRAMPDEKVADIMYQRFGGSPDGATLLAALPKERRESVQAHYVEIELMDPYGYRNGIDMAAQIAGKNDIQTIVNNPKSTLLGSLSQRVIRLQFEQKSDEARRDVHQHQTNLSQLQEKKSVIGKKWADRAMRGMNSTRIKENLNTKKTKAEHELATIAGDDGKLAKAKATFIQAKDTVNICKTKVQEAKASLDGHTHDTDKQEHLAMAEQALSTAEKASKEALTAYQLLDEEALSLQSEIAECSRQLEEFDLQTAALDASLREDLGIDETDDLNSALKSFNADINGQIETAKADLQAATEALAKTEANLEEVLEGIKTNTVTAYEHLDEDIIQHAYEVERADQLLDSIRLQIEEGKSPQDIASNDNLWEGFEGDGINEKLQAIRNQLESGVTEDVDWGTFREEVAANTEMLSAYKSLVHTVAELITNHLPEDQVEQFFNMVSYDLAIIEEHWNGVETTLNDTQLAAKAIKDFKEEGVRTQKAADAANIAKQGVAINGEHLTPANMDRNMEILGNQTVQSNVARRDGRVSKTDPKVDKAVYQAVGGNPEKLANINSIVVSKLDQLGALIFGTHEANLQQQSLGGPKSQNLKDLSNSEYYRLVGLESFHASIQDEAARIITGNDSVTAKSIKRIEDPNDLAEILVENEKFKRNPASFARLIADIKGKSFTEEVLIAVADKQISGIKLNTAIEALEEIPDDLPEPPQVGNVQAGQVALRTLKGEPSYITNDNFSREMRALGGSSETPQEVARRLIRYGGLNPEKLEPADIERRYGSFQKEVEDYRSALETHINDLRDLRDEGQKSGNINPKLIREIIALERELEGVEKLLDGLYFAETGGMRRPHRTQIDIGSFNLNLGFWHALTNDKFPYELRRIVRKETSVPEIQGKLANQINGDQALVLASKLEVYDRELEQMILKLEQLQTTQSQQGNPDPRIATAIRGYKQERQGLVIMRQAVNNLLPKEVEPLEIDMMEVTIEEIDIEDDDHNDRGRVVSDPPVIALSGNYDPSKEPVLDLGEGSIQIVRDQSPTIIIGDNIVNKLALLDKMDVLANNDEKLGELANTLRVGGDPQEVVNKLKVYQAQLKAHIEHNKKQGTDEGIHALELSSTVQGLGLIIPMIEDLYELQTEDDIDTTQSLSSTNKKAISYQPTTNVVNQEDEVLYDITEEEARMLAEQGLQPLFDLGFIDESDLIPDYDIDEPEYPFDEGVIIIGGVWISEDNIIEALEGLTEDSIVEIDPKASETPLTNRAIVEQLRETQKEFSALRVEIIAIEGEKSKNVQKLDKVITKLTLLEQLAYKAARPPAKTKSKDQGRSSLLSDIRSGIGKTKLRSTDSQSTKKASVSKDGPKDDLTSILTGALGNIRQFTGDDSDEDEDEDNAFED